MLIRDDLIAGKVFDDRLIRDVITAGLLADDPLDTFCPESVCPESEWLSVVLLHS